MMQPTRAQSPKYINNSYNSTAKKTNNPGENRLVVAKGGGKSGMDWEFGVR